MMQKSQIHFREVDDWIAIYKDGKKVDENHSLNLRDVLDIIGADYSYEYFEYDEFDPVTIAFPDGTKVFPDELE